MPPVSVVGMRHDAVGRGCQIVGPPCSDIHQAGDDRLASPGFEAAQIVPHHVRSGDATAGTVDPQHDRGIAGIAGDDVELFAKHGDGVFAVAVHACHVLIEQQAVDVDAGRSCGPSREPGR